MPVPRSSSPTRPTTSSSTSATLQPLREMGLVGPRKTLSPVALPAQVPLSLGRRRKVKRLLDQKFSAIMGPINELFDDIDEKLSFQFRRRLAKTREHEELKQTNIARLRAYTAGMGVKIARRYAAYLRLIRKNIDLAFGSDTQGVEQSYLEDLSGDSALSFEGRFLADKVMPLWHQLRYVEWDRVVAKRVQAEVALSHYPITLYVS